ncbi:MAG: hypothetical protein R3A52_32305 [Polyangiales bacterium]
MSEARPMPAARRSSMAATHSAVDISSRRCSGMWQYSQRKLQRFVSESVIWKGLFTPATRRSPSCATGSARRAARPTPSTTEATAPSRIAPP